MSLKCPVASKVAELSLLFDRPCWPDQHAVLSLTRTSCYTSHTRNLVNITRKYIEIVSGNRVTRWPENPRSGLGLTRAPSPSHSSHSSYSSRCHLVDGPLTCDMALPKWWSHTNELGLWLQESSLILETIHTFWWPLIVTSILDIVLLPTNNQVSHVCINWITVC